MKCKTIMVQGTASSVGKSLVTAGLCRVFRRMGYKVAPFKAQNMALNSFVTREGLEMGRAQVTQAEAAGVEPSVLMNPILLKPCSDKTSQVIINGRVRANMTAQEYYQKRHKFRQDVLEAFQKLTEKNDIIVIEGAGSPAEINLRENDLVNMGMADMASAPVILVGDIDRGGVFASLYGTVKLLLPDEQARFAGLIINKFRGDLDILKPGIKQIEELLQLPVLGVLPYVKLNIEEEDSLTTSLSTSRAPKAKTAISPPDGDTNTRSSLDVAVIRLPRISNFTDFAVLDHIRGVNLRYVDSAEQLAARSPDLIILPGSKSTSSDLAFLRQNGLDLKIKELHNSGTFIIGICGGFQMMGNKVNDPSGVESEQREIAGLGLLDMETVFALGKQTTQSQGRIIYGAGMLANTEGLQLSGYEIHMGQSFCGPASKPFLLLKNKSADNSISVKRSTCFYLHELNKTASLPISAKTQYPGTILHLNSSKQSVADSSLALLEKEFYFDGAVNHDGTVLGTYLHGLFDSMSFTRRLLENIARARGKSLASQEGLEQEYTEIKERAYDELANLLEQYLDIPKILDIAGFSQA